MLPGEPDHAAVRATGVPVVASPPPWRHVPHPRAPVPGYVDFQVRPGDRVKRGDVIATLRDIWGRPTGPDDGRVRTELDGAILWLRASGCVYPNQALCVFATADTAPPVAPWPS